MKGTSKLQSRHLSADRPLQRLRGCFLGDNAAVPPAYRVKVEKCASSVDILDVCKFTTFCDRKGYTIACYGVVQCLPVKIYRRNLRREKNDRLVSVHTSIDCAHSFNINRLVWTIITHHLREFAIHSALERGRKA